MKCFTALGFTEGGVTRTCPSPVQNQNPEPPQTQRLCSSSWSFRIFNFLIFGWIPAQVSFWRRGNPPCRDVGGTFGSLLISGVFGRNWEMCDWRSWRRRIVGEWVSWWRFWRYNLVKLNQISNNHSKLFNFDLFRKILWLQLRRRFPLKPISAHGVSVGNFSGFGTEMSKRNHKNLR